MLAIFTFSYAAVASDTIRLQLGSRVALVNGNIERLDVAPVQDGNTTVVPFRFIGEALGAKVSWDAVEQKVTLAMNGVSIALIIQQTEAWVNGKSVQMDVAPKIIDGSTMIPLRFVAESLNQEVGWDGDTGVITLSSRGQNSPSHHVTDDPAASIVLVEDGLAKAVIVSQIKQREEQALNEFQSAIRRATGVELPVVTVDELVNVPDDQLRIIIGNGPVADSLNIDVRGLERETYRILTKDNYLIFTGSNVQAYLSAVSHFLDHYLGVRWLWPGEIGTFVPKTNAIRIPELDITERPRMEIRELRAGDKSAETNRWLAVHMMGGRASYAYGHAFTSWWDLYSEDHPEYFAQPPAGKKQVRKDRVKLDLSNEAIDDVIIREWRRAGMPDNWNVSPNDGPGFCVSEGCLAMDEPKNQSINDIWDGEGEQTARYVKFWNRLYEKMRKINPNITISTYAYSSYRNPPPKGLAMNDGMIIGIVDTPRAYDAWQGWADTGAKLFLRPNWWHTAAGAPHLTLHETGDFFKFAHDNGMVGFDFDSIMGYWGTQGLNYYLIARLSVRPELTVDEVIDEYASAFGNAASAIKDYIAYWEQFSTEAAYTISAGNGVSTNPYGKYESIVREHNLPASPLHGGFYILPYLYTDEVLNKGRSFLEQAKQLAANDDQEVTARIIFLEDGLRELELTREVVRYGYIKTRPQGATEKQYIQMREQLDALREELAARHVIWSGSVKANEALRDIPTHESRTYGWRDPAEAPTTEEMDEKFQGL